MPRPRKIKPNSPGMLPTSRDKKPLLVQGTKAVFKALDNPDYQLKRDTSRESGKLTYDCRNCRLLLTEDDSEERRVICTQGHKLNAKAGDGSARAIQVIRGIRFASCQECPDYDGER